ncbi:MAG: NAD(+) kinase, partial [Deltaproteobacteria bacterium]
LPDTISVRIRVDERDSNVFLTFDGQVGLEVSHEDSIVIKKASHTIRMLQPPGIRYCDVLKAKLRWGGL